MEKEQSPEMNSALQALALSDIEEGMGHNVIRTQGLQEEIAQRRASLLQDLAEAQALKGQEELLAEIVKEEMAHQTQVSVLSHLHLRQAEEIRAQSGEIKRLSTLLKEQQTLLEQVQETQKQVSASVPQKAQPPRSRLSELQQEAFQYLPGTVNVRCRTGIQHLSRISQNIPVAGREHLKMNWLRPHGTQTIPAMCTLQAVRRGLHINTPETCCQSRGELHLAPPTRTSQAVSSSKYCLPTRL